ncbi:DUF996 domain-containing protein [Vulcanisaeta thermophila]|uniref:DUF996 domain-containing protein n=1 Tax=Vulcanisaeta thermophila TaxID=867917 RepID=UPI000853C9F1|nr:DUF996 domain-containing protein [Vulcanisaeta thermophila]
MASGLNVEDIRSAGLLGLIGIILMLLSIAAAVAYAGAGLGLVGLIMVLMALNKLSKAFNRPSIFRNALYAVITGIVGIVLIIVVVVLAYLAVNISAAVSAAPFTTSTLSRSYGSLASSIAIVIIFITLAAAVYIIIVFSYRFFRNAYIELAEASGIGDFRSTAKWYWYGALTAIVLVGVVLILIGHIYAALGYNKLREYKAQ